MRPLQHRWRLSIQQPYCTNFETVWECSDAVADGRVDWRLVLAAGCPVCGAHDCWRELTPYARKVIELLPYREGIILVARFQCRTTGKTFSLLPFCLVPYHQYSAISILFALLVAASVQGLSPQSLFAVAEKLLEPDSRTNGFLLGRWLVTCVSGLRRARPELARWAKLGEVEAGRDVPSWLAEVSGTLDALGVRGPLRLEGLDGLGEVLRRHASTTGRFLFGRPSQERRA